MSITEQQFEEWKSHPVTKDLFKHLNMVIDDIFASILSSDYLRTSNPYKTLETQLASIRAAKTIFNIKYENGGVEDGDGEDE